MYESDSWKEEFKTSSSQEVVVLLYDPQRANKSPRRDELWAAWRCIFYGADLRQEQIAADTDYQCVAYLRKSSLYFPVIVIEDFLSLTGLNEKPCAHSIRWHVFSMMDAIDVIDHPFCPRF